MKAISGEIISTWKHSSVHSSQIGRVIGEYPISIRKIEKEVTGSPKDAD
jgi:hypothetical protein